MNYHRDLWKEIKSEYLRQVEEALKVVGQSNTKEMLEDLDAHLERKYRDLTMEERSLEKFEKIIAQMGPASDYVELLKTGGSETPAQPPENGESSSSPNDGHDKASLENATTKRVGMPVFIPAPSPYDDHAVLRKAKWLGLGVLAAVVIAVLIFVLPAQLKHQDSEDKMPDSGRPPTIVSPPTAGANNNLDMDLQTYIISFTTASDVNAITARELFSLFSAKQSPKIKTHHYRTEVRENKLVGLICVDGKAALDTTTQMLLASNDLKLVSIEPATEETLKKLYAMGQPSLTVKPPVRQVAQQDINTSTANHIIVPGEQVGDFKLGMSKDDVLKKLGISEAENSIKGDGIILNIIDDKLTSIDVLSSLYKFINGLGIGDSEQKIKQTFGDEFQLKETEGKDFLIYGAQGLQFEIHKKNRTLMELSVISKSFSERRNETKVNNTQKIQPKYSGESVVFVAKWAVDGIVVGKSNCTARFVRSRLGAPKRIDSNGRMLRYTDDGIDFLFSPNASGPLSEIHLNNGFEGRLDTGISFTSTQQDVFAAYGAPVETIKADDLHGRNVERVLYQKDDTSRIYYGKCGLIFWFRDNHIVQIVVFEGQMKSADSIQSLGMGQPSNGFAENFLMPIQSWMQNGRTVDKIDYPFVSDPQAVGRWTSVDFVRSIENFDLANKSWSGDLYLKGMNFIDGGATGGPWTWTKGLVIHPGDKTAARYLIKDFNGVKYMFFEWKSGDYTLRQQKPSFYVLKKTG